MDTFTPVNPPDYDSNSVKRTPRTIDVSFGDGYAMSAPDGLNANDMTATYRWSNVQADEYNYLVDFYESHIGQTFKWQSPADRGGVGKWRITDFSEAVASYNSWTITIGFKRSFELG